MNPRILLLPALVYLTAAQHAFSQEEPTNSGWKHAMDHIGLLPETKSPYGAGNPSYLAEQIGRKLTEEELTLLGRDATGKWKQYSDGFIRFDLPDDPLLNVEIFEPKQKPHLEVVGGAVGSTDNRFQKVYRITFSDGAPYGLILVSAADWFDEGLCMCGPIDLKTFVHTEGNLIELSQLPDGAIKKSQIINGSHRAILFEWTHSSLTQDAYARISASVRFDEKSPKSQEEWVAFSIEKRGFEGKLGWLYPNITAASVETLLGEPSRKSDNTLNFISEHRYEDGRGYRMSYKLPIQEGKLTRFGDSWQKYEDLDAPRGTHAWMEDKVRYWERGDNDSDPFSNEDEKPLPIPDKDDLKLILSTFHEQAPLAIGKDWEFWCNILADLKRLEISDEKAAQLVESRSVEMDLPHHHTRWILELYELPTANDFVFTRLRYLMDQNPEKAKYLGEAHNLFASLSKGDPKAHDLLREGVSSPVEKIREPAVYFVRKLPTTEARSILKLALADESSRVRRDAILNVQHLYTKEDTPWLEKLLAQEPDESNRELFQEKISQLLPDKPDAD